MLCLVWFEKRHNFCCKCPHQWLLTPNYFSIKVQAKLSIHMQSWTAISLATSGTYIIATIKANRAVFSPSTYWGDVLQFLWWLKRALWRILHSFFFFFLSTWTATKIWCPIFLHNAADSLAFTANFQRTKWAGAHRLIHSLICTIIGCELCAPVPFVLWIFFSLTSVQAGWISKRQ